MESLHPESTKSDLEGHLHNAFDAVRQFINDLPEEDFRSQPVNGKWAPAEHLVHLTKSAYPVTSALKQPKFIFRAFGLSRSGSMSFDQLHQQYMGRLADGVKAPPTMVAKQTELLPREELLANWQIIADKFSPRLAKWSESDLDKYRAPHPALGKITFRELLYFTIFHTHHHLQIMQRDLSAKTNADG